MQRALGQVSPTVHPDALVSELTYLVGDVTIDAEASLWAFVCLRGDFEPVTVGERTNMQYFMMLHGAKIGSGVTIGHNVVVDEATVGDDTLIGISSSVLPSASVGSECIVAAGALVREHQEIPDGHMVYAVPAETQLLTDQNREDISCYCDTYLEMVDRYRTE